MFPENLPSVLQSQLLCPLSSRITPDDNCPTLYSAACQGGRRRRPRFDPWAGTIPWRRKWQPHSSVLAWRLPWTEEPGGLQSIGSQRVGHDRVTDTHYSAETLRPGTAFFRIPTRCRLSDARIGAKIMLIECD